MDGGPEEILSAEIDDFLGPEEEEASDGSEEQALEEADLPAEEEGADDGEEEGEEDEVEPVLVEKAPLPASWSKEDAKVWETLPPDAQAVVARREAERDKYVRKVGFEASQTRQQVETQAREVIAQLHDNHAQALAVYAQQFTPQPPDQRLLYTGNPDDVLTYQRQDAAYRAGADQQQQLHQQIQQIQQQANLARTQAQQAERGSDAQRLKEQLPEWFDPSEGPKLQTELQSIGAELGYPVELMAEASSTDILALKKAAEWKADAEKYRKLMGSKMEAVRAAKGLPKMARPGVKPPKGQVNATATQKAWDQVKKTKSPDAMADWLEKSGFM